MAEKRKLWSWILVQRIGEGSSPKLVQVMILDWPFAYIFLRKHWKMCGKVIGKGISQYVIEVAKAFGYNENSSPPPWGYEILKWFLPGNRWVILTTFHVELAFEEVLKFSLLFLQRNRASLSVRFWFFKHWFAVVVRVQFKLSISILHLFRQSYHLFELQTIHRWYQHQDVEVLRKWKQVQHQAGVPSFVHNHFHYRGIYASDRIGSFNKLHHTAGEPCYKYHDSNVENQDTCSVPLTTPGAPESARFSKTKKHGDAEYQNQAERDNVTHYHWYEFSK